MLLESLFDHTRTLISKFWDITLTILHVYVFSIISWFALHAMICNPWHDFTRNNATYNLAWLDSNFGKKKSHFWNACPYVVLIGMANVGFIENFHYIKVNGISKSLGINVIYGIYGKYVIHISYIVAYNYFSI